MSCCEGFDERIKELEARIKEADKTLAWYADPLNYNLGSNVLGCERPVNDLSKTDWIDPDSDLKYSGSVGGKRARAYLAKYKEQEKR